MGVVSTVAGCAAHEFFVAVTKIAACISDSHITTAGDANLLLVFLSLLPVIPRSGKVSRLVMVVASCVSVINCFAGST